MAFPFAAVNRTVDPVFSIVQAAAPRDLERLRRSASFHTSSSDLAAALRAAANDDLPPGPNIAESAAIRAAADAAIAASIDEAAAAREWHEREEAARNQALAGLDRLDRLPPVYSAALLRSAGVGERNLATLRGRVDDPATQQQIAAAVARLDDITPPATECSDDGARLVRGDEDKIRAEAEALAEGWAGFYRAYPDHPHAAATRAERRCPYWWRRQLRREALRAQAYYDCALRLARPGSLYCSSYTLAAYASRQARGEAWAKGTIIRWSDGDEVSLFDVITNGKKSRLAQMYAMVKAMEWTAENQGYTALFLTLTLPGEWHALSSGAAGPDGKYRNARENPDWSPERGPRAQIEELNRRWRLIRARIAKFNELRDYYGILVPEPHKSGTPHFHAMIWLPTRTKSGELAARVVRRILRDIAPVRQSKLEIVRKRPGRRSVSPASYVMKYLMKALSGAGDAPNGEAPNGEEHMIGEAHDRYRAWASARGIRRMRLLGLHGALRIWQRIWIASDDEPMSERASRARAFIRAGRAAGAAEEEATDAAEKARHHEEQAESFARALGAIGALPHLGDGGSLRLMYRESATVYGRATKKAVAFIDSEQMFATLLQPRYAELMSVEDVEREKATKKRSEKFLKTLPVTVVPIYPRGGSAPRPVDPTHPAALAAQSIANVISAREGLPQWQEWCDRHRERIPALLDEARNEAA